MAKTKKTAARRKTDGSRTPNPGFVSPFGPQAERWVVKSGRVSIEPGKQPPPTRYRVMLIGSGYYPKPKPYYEQFERVEPDERHSLLSPTGARVEEIVRYGTHVRWTARQETRGSGHIDSESYLLSADDEAAAAALATRLLAERSKRPQAKQPDIFTLYNKLDHLLYLAPAWERLELLLDFFTTLRVHGLEAHAIQVTDPVPVVLSQLAASLEMLRQGREPDKTPIELAISYGLKGIRFQGHPWGEARRRAKPVPVAKRGSETDLLRQMVLESRVDEAIEALLRMKPTDKGYRGIAVWSPTRWYAIAGVALVERLIADGRMRDAARVRQRLLDGSEIDDRQRDLLARTQN